MSASATGKTRLVSLDQFRGYTVLGMFFVNFAGSYLATPAIFKHHHTYCSYADTIMPQFFFAVGFAYRLTFLRQLQSAGFGSAVGKVVRRNLGLILLGAIIHGIDVRVRSWQELEDLGVEGFFETAFQRNFFQTLTHIGVTALWILPVLNLRPGWRVAFAIVSAGLHVWLSHLAYYEWVMRRPGIDGGPLGFLTWTTPMIAGTLAYDLMASRGAAGSLKPLLGFGTVLMALGYGLSCLNLVVQGAETFLIEPPFVAPSYPVDYWTMSQRAGSISYLVFGAGFSAALYALFVWICDLHGARLVLFDTLGQNALAGYVIHILVNRAITPFVPRDAPLWFVLAGFALSFAFCFLFLRHLEKHRLYLRL
ncbi:MAG: hypothetical protein L0215_16585 [Gemmataceae bacterium]|nr:hypothetical protein [Gemmataceae bacterium]